MSQANGCDEWPYTSMYGTKVLLQKETPVIALSVWQACRHLVQKLTTCLQFTQQNPFDDRASGSVGEGWWVSRSSYLGG